LRRFLRGVADVQYDDLANRIVDRIKDRKRITHDWQDSYVCLVGQVPDEGKLASSDANSSTRFVTEIAADRLRS
jgi:hypothetical protein